MNKSDLVSIREYCEKDIGFVYSNFLKGLYTPDTWYSLVHKHIFFTNYHAIVQKIVEDPKNKVLITCLKDDPDTVLSFAVISRDGKVLHFAYCKKAWRGIGLTKAMIPPTVKFVTHLTKAGIGIIRKHPDVQYNPFLIQGEK